MENDALLKIKKDSPGLYFWVRTTLRGAGQVMFQQSALTGLLFLIGIIIGAYIEKMPQVGWGALVGLVVSTFTGRLLDDPGVNGRAGLWGFNGILVGCAFPTFLGNTWLMWICLIICAAMTTIVRRSLNNITAAWKINSLTFPFVLMTWVFLLSSRMFAGMPPVNMSAPELPGAVNASIDMGLINLLEYWLKGIAQVFLINSWETGIIFLIGLYLCNKWAALWAALGSAIALGVALLFGGSGHDIADGLYGFSAVLTGIALGCTFYKTNWRVAIWAILGIFVTVFVQASMNTLLAPLGLPTLTGPFCLTTWLFLLPLYKFNNWNPDGTTWAKEEKEIEQD